MKGLRNCDGKSAERKWLPEALIHVIENEATAGAIRVRASGAKTD